MKTKLFIFAFFLLTVVFAQEGKKAGKGISKQNKIPPKSGPAKKFVSRTGAKLTSLSAIRGRKGGQSAVFSNKPFTGPKMGQQPPVPKSPMAKCAGRCAYPQETCAKKARCNGPNCYFCAVTSYFSETKSLVIPRQQVPPRRGPTAEEFARLVAFKTAQAVAAIDPNAIANEILKKNKPKPPKRPAMRMPMRRRPMFPQHRGGMPSMNSIRGMRMNPYSMGMNPFGMGGMTMGGMGGMGGGMGGMGGGMGGMGLDSLMAMNMLGIDIGL